MRVFTIAVLIATGSVVQGQSSPRQLRFVPQLAGYPLVLNGPMVLGDDLPITVTAFRFYAGHFTYHRHGEWLLASNEYRLVDAADTASLSIDLGPATATSDSISFLLGVDSLTNVSGAFGGDLDPIKGMYWTWNSGYINLKLEGSSPASPYPSHAFELHLGGYLPPFPTAQRVTPPVGAMPLSVHVELMPLLNAAGIHTRCNVMSPGEAAMRLSRVAATMFRTDAGR